MLVGKWALADVEVWIRSGRFGCICGRTNEQSTTTTRPPRNVTALAHYVRDKDRRVSAIYASGNKRIIRCMRRSLRGSLSRGSDSWHRCAAWGFARASTLRCATMLGPNPFGADRSRLSRCAATPLCDFGGAQPEPTIPPAMENWASHQSALLLRLLLGVTPAPLCVAPAVLCHRCCACRCIEFVMADVATSCTTVCRRMCAKPWS